MKWPRIVGIALIVIALLVGAWYGSGYVLEALNQSADKKYLAEKEAKEAEKAAREAYLKEHPEITYEANDETNTSDVTYVSTTVEMDGKLRIVENDVVAKITIEACGIESLVYQNAEKNYYLRRDASGKSSRHGEIYTNCYDCDCPMIYGHHMSDGSMFAGLDKAYIGATVLLEDIGYLKDEVRTYEITAIKKDIPGNQVMEYLSELDSGLVLITCSYGVDDGRLVVVCKEIETAG